MNWSRTISDIFNKLSLADIDPTERLEYNKEWDDVSLFYGDDDELMRQYLTGDFIWKF